MYTTNTKFINESESENNTISIQIKDLSVVTSNFTIIPKYLYDTFNYRPYTEGSLWCNHNYSIIRQDSNNCMIYYLSYQGKAITIKNPNKIGKLYILDNHKHLNDVKHSRGNVIIGRNYYAVDTSDIAREVTIINRD